MALWQLGKKDEARPFLEQADAAFDGWCRERASGRGTPWITWWYDGLACLTLRREAHVLMEGKPTDDTNKLDKIRSAMAGLLTNRDSPTWAFDAALRLAPTSSAHKIAMATRLIDLGRSTEAEPMIASATEAQPDNPAGWFERGKLFAVVGQQDRAAAVFARALDKVPQDFSTWGERAKLCMKMSEHPEAFDRLLESRRNDALLWFIRAEHHLIKREYPAAVADFLGGGEPTATSEFGFAFAAALLLAGEESAYREYVNRQADRYGTTGDPATLFVLARMAMLAKNPPVPPERMVRWANRAVLETPTFAWYAHVQAIAALRAGELETAARSLESAKKLAWSPGGQALNDVATAMLELARGRGSSASAAFAATKAAFARKPTVHFQSDLVIIDWLEYQALCSQIEGPLEDAVFPDNPFAAPGR